MYHGIARSNGHGYWPSFAYTFAASALWEIAGETTPPSRNDQIASGLAGSFLGEPLFRISRLLLERADRGPGVWRRLGVVLVSPPTGLNHLLVGDSGARASARRRAVFRHPRPDRRHRELDRADRNRCRRWPSTQPRLGLSMDYGYPGNASYRHKRPFDYFRIESSVSSEGLEQLSTRGLIAGADYGAGSPQPACGASTAPTTTSRPTTSTSPARRSRWHDATSAAHPSRWWCRAPVSLAAAMPPRMPLDDTSGHESHYGVTPQALANVRVIGGRRAALDVTAHQVLRQWRGGFGTGQRDPIFVGDASLASASISGTPSASLSACRPQFGLPHDPDQTAAALDGSARSTPSSALVVSARCARAAMRRSDSPSPLATPAVGRR